MTTLRLFFLSRTFHFSVRPIEFKAHATLNPKSEVKQSLASERSVADKPY